MRIAVVTPSRNRVVGLSAVLQTLRYLESGKHEVRYGVISDEDDPATFEWCKTAKHIPLVNRVEPRYQTMGGAINEMSEWMHVNLGSEVFTVINDDILCLTPNWDDIIAKAVEETPHGVFWWNDTNEQGYEALYPIVTDKWRKAAGGLFTDYFPFWYDDLCLAELWTMTTDSDNIRLDCQICDKPVKTTRMRELSFWQQVYTKSRKLRVAKAYEMADKLGLPRPSSPEMIKALVDSKLKRVSDEWLDSIEQNQGETTAPDSAYLDAKARAEVLLQSIGD